MNCKLVTQSVLNFTSFSRSWRCLVAFVVAGSACFVWVIWPERTWTCHVTRAVSDAASNSKSQTLTASRAVRRVADQLAAAQEAVDSPWAEVSISGASAAAEAFNADASSTAGADGIYAPHPLAVSVQPAHEGAKLLPATFRYYPALNIVTAGPSKCSAAPPPYCLSLMLGSCSV